MHKMQIIIMYARTGWPAAPFSSAGGRTYGHDCQKAKQAWCKMQTVLAFSKTHKVQARRLHKFLVLVEAHKPLVSCTPRCTPVLNICAMQLNMHATHQHMGILLLHPRPGLAKAHSTYVTAHLVFKEVVVQVPLKAGLEGRDSGQPVDGKRERHLLPILQGNWLCGGKVDMNDLQDTAHTGSSSTPVTRHAERPTALWKQRGLKMLYTAALTAMHVAGWHVAVVRSINMV